MTSNPLLAFTSTFVIPSRRFTLSTSTKQRRFQAAPIRPVRIDPHAQQAQPEAGDEGAAPPPGEETPSETVRRKRRERGKDASVLFDNLASVPVEVDEMAFRPQTEAAKAVVRSQSLLMHTFTVLPGQKFRDYEKSLEKTSNLLLASALAILLGFFMATSISVIVVSFVEWDTVWAGILLVWVEAFTRWYYMREEKPGRILQLVNAFKIGIIYGLCVDAFKVGS